MGCAQVPLCCLPFAVVAAVRLGGAPLGSCIIQPTGQHYMLSASPRKQQQHQVVSASPMAVVYLV